jgi:hypothetical protein
MASDVNTGIFDISLEEGVSDLPTEPVTTKPMTRALVPQLKADIKLGKTKPIVAAVLTEALRIFQSQKSDLALAEEFIDTDPTVGGNADALGLLVQKAYRGPRIKPRVTDKDETTGEIKDNIARKIAIALEAADDVLYDMDFKGMLFSNSVNAFQDGNVVLRILPNMEFRMLPMRYVTALPAKFVEKAGENKWKTVWGEKYGPGSGNFSAIFEETTVPGSGVGGREILMDADFYVVNENTEAEIVIPKGEIIHIKLNPYGRTTIDNMNRTCFNLWSASPMKRLKKTLLWKANTMVNDILWRDSMPPREHHKLDLSMFSPDNYDGDTPEARVEAARAAALGVINNYIKYISHKAVDVGYVTDLITEIDVIESKARNYAEPNDLMRQLDEAVHATSGVPRGAMYGESQGAYASELLISNYAGLRAEFMGDRIARPFEKWLIQYIKDNYPDTVGKKIANRIRLKFRLILPRDLREMAQGVNLLMQSMIVDVAQILETVGLDVMTNQQFSDHLKLVKQMAEASGSLKFGEVDKKSFKDDGQAVSRKQETPDTRAGKEMNLDNM